MSRAYVPEHLRPQGRPRWPFTVPCVAEVAAHGLELTAPITIVVGENGSGKSTLVEAMADAFQLDSYGGRAGRKYTNDRERTALGDALRFEMTAAGSRMITGPRNRKKGYFLRAETAFGLMNTISAGRVPGYWEEDTRRMSHGEGFLTVFAAMFDGPGLYLMDEPEAALSFTSCLQLVALMRQLGTSGAQVVCATHSPILAATPGADIVEVGDHGVRRTRWEDLAIVGLWRRYLADPESVLRHLIDD